MLTHFRHIIVWSLIGSLLFGQTGFSLHQIYCFCKGEWEASIFTEESMACEAEEEDGIHALPACCKKDAECTAFQPDTESAPLPCTNDQVVYLQLDQPAVPGTQNNGDSFQEWSLHLIFPSFAYFSPEQKYTGTPGVPYLPPDLKDGRSIRTWVKSFLC